MTFDASLNVMPCFSRNALELSRHLAIDAWHNAVEEFNDSHFRAKPPPHRTKLRPITPAPTMSILPGTFESVSAPVEEMIRVSSISMP